MANSQRMRPYYVVIFTSRKKSVSPGYEEAAQRMMELVTKMPGFLGAQSARGSDGLGITVSYWESIEALKAWGQDPAHRATQKRGREDWYEEYSVKIAQVGLLKKWQRRGVQAKNYPQVCLKAHRRKIFCDCNEAYALFQQTQVIEEKL